jgi:S-adenosylmethionine:tRNA ribosyltransferase-isomerase
MQISDFDYSLPDELIARYPAAERRASRLLEVGPRLADRHFAELPALLGTGDLLVFNDTRVIPARLAAVKDTGGRAEILIERIESERCALAQVRASKSPKKGGRLRLASGDEVVVAGRDAEFFLLDFPGPVLTILEAIGEVPLPPYIDRVAEPEDAERYQTVYAKDPGAVAAPTAGLHFDRQMLDETLASGVRHTYITLHVGAGTFQALRHEQIAENRLHTERVQVSTAVRALECASVSGEIMPFQGETDLFILPGYEFRSVDAMITNFHLPRSSLLMLVAAFAGRERILRAYEHAVRSKYRFFSYGDSMFVTPGADE